MEVLAVTRLMSRAMFRYANPCFPALDKDSRPCAPAWAARRAGFCTSGPDSLLVRNMVARWSRHPLADVSRGAGS